MTDSNPESPQDSGHGSDASAQPPVEAKPPAFAPPPYRPVPPLRSTAVDSSAKTPQPPLNLPPPISTTRRAPDSATAPAEVAASGIYPGAASPRVHPKQETARVGAVPPPAPPAKLRVDMTKTQPLIQTPTAEHHAVPVTVAKSSVGGTINAIPRPLLWALLGVSLVTLLIQLWNYFSV